MTEAHTFKLTTAENELGVVIACSEYGDYLINIQYCIYNFSLIFVILGHSMTPISWTEMQCTKTGIVEYRKVAKIGQDDENKKV